MNKDGENERFSEVEREYRLHTDDLVLCNESKDRSGVEVYKRYGLKLNVKRNKVIVLSGKEGSVCEVSVHGRYWSMPLNLSTGDLHLMNQVQMEQNIIGKVVQVNPKSLQLMCKDAA